MKGVIKHLVGTVYSPPTGSTFKALLQQLNAHYDLETLPLYGIHGIDDNPRLNPLGDVAYAGDACQSDADCGAPGNVCTTTHQGQRICAVSCTVTSACGTGQWCQPHAGTEGQSGACVSYWSSWH